jgi:hypothetical protein
MINEPTGPPPPLPPWPIGQEVAQPGLNRHGTGVPGRFDGKSTPAGCCPACGAWDNYREVVQLRSSFNWLVFLAGGLWALLFFNASRKTRVQCNQCEALFDIRKPFSGVSKVIFWLLISPVIASMVVGLVLMIIELIKKIA